jgi:hypothetical protein
MQGKIVAYSDAAKAGVIQAMDGKLLTFIRANWISAEAKPQNGLRVTFKPGARSVTQVKVVS